MIVNQTVDGAAHYHVKYGQPKPKTITEAKFHSFKAGAEWQMEQLKTLFDLANNAANVCESEGDMYTATMLRNEIERLQDYTKT